ncbi:MAG TPA: hypothetical protein VFX60_15610 [Micromonospora sp.]|nr:hypothetical protein [Micromonospora sp.]
MELSRNTLRSVVRVLRQPDAPVIDSSGPPRLPSGGPIPAPSVAPLRCGCWTPLLWDSHIGRWLHLDDLTPCVPGLPRH